MTNNGNEELVGVGIDGEDFKVVRSLTKISASHNYYYKYSFSPPGTTMVTENDGEHKVAIVTTYASEYYSAIKESMEVLATETEEDIAERFGTSVSFARHAKKSLLDKFARQLEAGNNSEEILAGIVVNENNDVFVVGRRILPSGQRKVSKMTAIRRSLPVGRFAVYPTSENSVVYELRNNLLDKKTYSKEWASVSDLYVQKTQKALVIADTQSYREKCGRTLLTNKSRWKVWNSDGSLDNAVIAIVQGDDVVVYDREELIAKSYKEIYEGYTPNGDAINMEAVYKAIVLCRERFMGQSVDVSVYLPGYGTNTYNFVSSIMTYANDQLQGKKKALRVSFARYGHNGSSLLQSLDWKLRISASSVGIGRQFYFDNNNRRLKDFMLGYRTPIGSLSFGIEFDPERANGYILTHGKATLADIAQLLGVATNRVLVSPKVGSGPPYVFNRGNTFIITPSHNMPEGVLAMGATPDTILETNDAVMVLSKDSPELLAKGSVL